VTSVLIVLHAMDQVITCPPGTNMNLACGVVENLDYSGVKAATGNFNMTIITLGITQGCYHSILSRRSARPKALSMPCG
jgi:hypothetical protein